MNTDCNCKPCQCPPPCGCEAAPSQCDCGPACNCAGACACTAPAA